MKSFKALRLDTANHLLWRDGERVPLAPKGFDVLAYLVEHAGRVLTQDEILEALWSETYVNPELLRKYIVKSGRLWVTGPITRNLLKHCPSGDTCLLLLS
jgi:DNA-binding response OmpR family regulator